MKYKEISHWSHPHQGLKFGYAEAPFKCDGCKEVGIGSSYKCDGAACDFDLHSHCAIPSPTLVHPFYPKCAFQFLRRPPGTEARCCNACERRVTGFVYHCKLCGFDLHPCCAKLPMLHHDADIKLFLYAKVTAPCHRCGRKGRSWSYRSSCKKYNLHVACVMDMLVDSWHELYNGNGGGGGVQQIPSLKATLETHVNHTKTKGGKAKKCCEMAALALQFVVSAILGDPTTLIAGLIASFMSK
ncbi:hypothetical protein SASPL_101136 [Salvia splendens]|uniref:DC1 domain-containing protein n=1 Tax=Salvia splendens TaxID=180675 RepID=A0A8X8YU98_SALSN|nr:uncharacterized protein LOC121795789 [Salvia splendens]KAG6436250.1 hypothetical protein SASPL_101136 [Salvia splendens]